MLDKDIKTILSKDYPYEKLKALSILVGEKYIIKIDVDEAINRSKTSFGTAWCIAKNIKYKHHTVKYTYEKIRLCSKAGFTANNFPFDLAESMASILEIELIDFLKVEPINN